jgi:hypothetical protein
MGQSDDAGLTLSRSPILGLRGQKIRSLQKDSGVCAFQSKVMEIYFSHRGWSLISPGKKEHHVDCVTAALALDKASLDATQ